MTNWWQSIRDNAPQIKPVKSVATGDVIVSLTLIFVGIGSFGLGRLSLQESVVPAVQYVQREKSLERPMILGGFVVASKRGTKYHFPWCAGARAMNAENMVWFDSVTDAQRAGYTPAGNCKGLE